MKTRILPALAILAAAAAFFFPVLSGKGVFYPFDILGAYLPWSTLDIFHAPRNRLIIDTVLGFYPPHFYPSQSYFQQALKSGTFPLWYTANFCGTPFILFSSPIPFLLFSLLPLTSAHDLLLFVHLAAAGLLTFWYLRKLGLAWISALIGGICWMFNGYVMVWFEFEHVLMLAAVLPAALLAMEIWHEKRTAAAFLAMAVSFALTLSVSYAHLIIYQTAFYGVYFLALLLRPREPGRHRAPGAAGFIAGTALALAVAVAVSANFFTSHLMLLKEGQRRPYGYEELFEKTGRLQPEHLSMLLFPDLFGNPVRGVTATPRPRQVRVYDNYNELCIYPGVFCLFLALAGAAQIGRRRHAAFFLAAAAVVIALAMGSILFYPLWRFVPGLNLSTPTRVLYLFGFAVSVLAAVGADALLAGEGLRRKTTACLWLLAVAAAAALAGIVQTEAGVKWISSTEGWTAPARIIARLMPYYAMTGGVVGRPLLLTAISALLLFPVLRADRRRRAWLLAAGGVLLFTDLAGFGLFYNTVSPRSMAFPETPAIAFLQKDPTRYRIMASPAFPSHGFVPFGIEDIAGYGSFYPRRYGEYIYLSQYGQDAKIPERLSRRISLNQAGSPLLDVINTKYLLTPATQKPDLPGFSLVYDGKVRIFENRRAFDRVFFVPRYQRAENRKEALSLLRTFSHDDFAETVILESKTALPPFSDASPAKAKISVLSWEADRMRLAVDSPSSGFVVVGDNYHPGWKATVDGKKTRIFRADYILRAVSVKKGKHVIEMVFRPRLALAGVWATAAGWPLLLAACGVVLFKGRKRKRPRKGPGAIAPMQE